MSRSEHIIAAFDLVEHAAAAAEVQSSALGPVAADRSVVFARHACYPGFRALGAFDGAALVGFAYGVACRPGQWWYDQISRALVDAGHGAMLEDAYAVTELHVLPGHQGRGLGLRLLAGLLEGVPHSCAVLSTYDADSRARALYRGVGFADLVTGFRFPVQDQEYALMAAPLPLHGIGAGAAGGPISGKVTITGKAER